ncbi:MAG: TonB-dependent receptor, partial [Desulfamplus sp.]|nr:TonB-dependent receptor [Desulfamplus sp.]
PSFAHNTSTRLASDLPPLTMEKIETFELGYITYFSPDYMLNANFFHNELEDLLERGAFINSSGQYLGFLGNSGNSKTNGLELSFQAKPTDKATLELSATYQETEDLNNPEAEPAYSPKWSGQFKLGYDITPKICLGLKSFYVSEMDVFFDPSLKNSDGSFGRQIKGSVSDDYIVAGVNLRFKDFFYDGTVINLHIDNIFNKEITYPTYTKNSWMDKGSVGEERTFMVTVAYQF